MGVCFLVSLDRVPIVPFLKEETRQSAICRRWRKKRNGVSRLSDCWLELGVTGSQSKSWEEEICIWYINLLYCLVWLRQKTHSNLSVNHTQQPTNQPLHTPHELSGLLDPRRQERRTSNIAEEWKERLKSLYQSFVVWIHQIRRVSLPPPIQWELCASLSRLFHLEKNLISVGTVHGIYLNQVHREGLLLKLGTWSPWVYM